LNKNIIISSCINLEFILCFLCITRKLQSNFLYRKSFGFSCIAMQEGIIWLLSAAKQLKAILAEEQTIESEKEMLRIAKN